MIYIVHQSDGYDSHGETFFDNEAMAKKYCEIHEQIDPEYTWYVSTAKFSTFDLNAKVVDYYCFYVGKEPECTLESIMDYKCELTWYFRHELQILPEDFNDEILKSILDDLSDDKKQVMLDYLNDIDNRYENDDDTEKRIYEGDLIIENTKDYIQVYSINSFEEAKQKALELYNEWKNSK